MTDAATSDIEDTKGTHDTEATEAPSAKMPPAVRLPKVVQGVLLAGFRRFFLRTTLKRLGPVFAINVPFFGRSVVVSDPAGNRKLDKAKARFRIDGAVALAMALGLKAKEGPQSDAAPQLIFF